ncbi:MAG: sugar phosphate isomerase/epimerase [Spirochaetaceae bacterium]|nr:MAG: sugar phosphate isomerase/epimerase [Spirochaetaceae bacterium]
MPKYSVILGNLGNTCDRFLSSGYKDVPPMKELLKQAAEIDGVEGVELVGTWDITVDTVDEVGSLLQKHGLECVSIIPDLFSQKRWGKGTLSAKDAATRKQAVEYMRGCVEIARKINCPTLNIWPGQDGYDYYLSSDLVQERRWLQENIRAVAAQAPDIRFALEYKPKEPRNFSFLARAADTLLMVKEIGLDNVGVCIDTGHGFVAGENIGESIVILQQYGKKLFHMHFNDNHGSWDDDMIVGSVHFPLYVEIIYWLRESGYDGWYSMDQYPYREDGKGAIEASIRFLQMVERVLDARKHEELKTLMREGDNVRTQNWLRETFFK